MCGRYAPRRRSGQEDCSRWAAGKSRGCLGGPGAGPVVDHQRVRCGGRERWWGLPDRRLADQLCGRVRPPRAVRRDLPRCVPPGAGGAVGAVRSAGAALRHPDRLRGAVADPLEIHLVGRGAGVWPRGVRVRRLGYQRLRAQGVTRPDCADTARDRGVPGTKARRPTDVRRRGLAVYTVAVFTWEGNARLLPGVLFLVLYALGGWE